jgi:hypothetical protein
LTIDRDDLAEGIYLTVWSPEFGDSDGQVPPFAKRTLLSGLRQLPFVVQSRSYDARTLYSAPTVPELLKASQKNQKVLRDAKRRQRGIMVVQDLVAYMPHALVKHHHIYNVTRTSGLYLIWRKKLYLKQIA